MFSFLIINFLSQTSAPIIFIKELGPNLCDKRIINRSASEHWKSHSRRAIINLIASQFKIAQLGSRALLSPISRGKTKSLICEPDKLWSFSWASYFLSQTSSTSLSLLQDHFQSLSLGSEQLISLSLRPEQLNSYGPDYREKKTITIQRLK